MRYQYPPITDRESYFKATQEEDLQIALAHEPSISHAARIMAAVRYKDAWRALNIWEDANNAGKPLPEYPSLHEDALAEALRERRD